MNHPAPAPRSLSRTTRILLWALRAYVIVAVPLVILTFINTLKH